jgi:hypothetical protein
MEPSPRTDNPIAPPEDTRPQASFGASNLTWSQWQLWYEQCRRPPYILSPLTATFAFTGSLDSREFRQAFQSVVDRSDALRMVFVEEGGVPRRYVLPRLPLALSIVDLSAAYQPAEAFTQWQADRDLRPLSPALRPFDSTLVRLGEQDYIWRLSLHRLIADSQSLLLIYRHTAAAYAAAATNAAGDLPSLPLFEDFAGHDREWARSIALRDVGSVSRTAARIPLALPVRGERFGLDVGVERTALLRRAAANLASSLEGEPALAFQNAGTALFLLCSAALAALLARLRGCSTVCIDTEVDLRAASLWQETIGRISRPQTLSVHVAEATTLADLVSALRVELARPQGTQTGPGSEQPAACHTLLHVDDITFPPFGDLSVKVERLDSCHCQPKTRAGHALKPEPTICLTIDSFDDAANLKAVFTFCSAHLPRGRGQEIAQKYMQMLDALVAAREQPLHALV